jgi:hypothetical protein
VTYRVIGQQGKKRFLLSKDEVMDASAMGVILDEREGVAYDPLPVQSIIARGYWENFEGDPSPILNLAETLGIR